MYCSFQLFSDSLFRITTEEYEKTFIFLCGNITSWKKLHTLVVATWQPTLKLFCYTKLHAVLFCSLRLWNPSWNWELNRSSFIIILAFLWKGLLGEWVLLWYHVIFHSPSSFQFHSFGNQKPVELLATWKQIMLRWQTSWGLQVWMGSLAM